MAAACWLTQTASHSVVFDRSVHAFQTRKLHSSRLESNSGPRDSALQLHLKRFSSLTGYGSRSRGIMYDDSNTYVLLEPGEDEVFVSLEQLKSRLKAWLERWPEALPNDLAKFETLDRAVNHLVNNACELEVGEGFGSIQWFQVTLEERD